VAAFYRRSAVIASDGVELRLFDPSLGDRYADVDLALRLQQAGYRASFEPKSIIFRRPDEPLPDGFASAVHAERLFWRHAPAAGWNRSILKHGLVVAREFCRGLTDRKTMARLAGRLVTSCDWQDHRRQRRRWALASAVGLAPASSAPSAMTNAVHRIDKSHNEPDRPPHRASRKATQSV
jgi:hypothetical protein